MSYPVTEYWGGCHLVDFQQAADEKKEEVENLLEEERGSGSGSGGGESVTKGNNFQKSERAQVRSVRALVVRGGRAGDRERNNQRGRSTNGRTANGRLNLPKYQTSALVYRMIDRSSTDLERTFRFSLPSELLVDTFWNTQKECCELLFLQ